MNHYQKLRVDSKATGKEIKQAYRKLAKIYHPDTHHLNAEIAEAGSEEMIQINAAYEILSNPQARRRYDQELKLGTDYQELSQRQSRTAQASQEYVRRRRANKVQDVTPEKWLQVVYYTSDRYIKKVIEPLESEIDLLAADPFDDELLSDFQTYLEDCRHHLQLAKQKFAAYPNPSPCARVAANLYYCLNQLEDGIKELEYFTFNYDEHYLHTGQEIFRIAEGLRRDAAVDVANL